MSDHEKNSHNFLVLWFSVRRVGQVGVGQVGVGQVGVGQVAVGQVSATRVEVVAYSL